MKRTLLPALSAALLAPVSALAAPLPPSGVFTYSGQCISPESGDLYGLRITVLRVSNQLLSGKNLQVVFYLEDEVPVLINGAYDPKTGSLHFEVPVDDAPHPPWVFDGVVDTKQFTGRSSSEGAFSWPIISNGASKIRSCK